jgi:hypothetical protein
MVVVEVVACAHMAKDEEEDTAALGKNKQSRNREGEHCCIFWEDGEGENECSGARWTAQIKKLMMEEMQQVNGDDKAATSSGSVTPKGKGGKIIRNRMRDVKCNSVTM